MQCWGPAPGGVGPVGGPRQVLAVGSRTEALDLVIKTRIQPAPTDSLPYDPHNRPTTPRLGQDVDLLRAPPWTWYLPCKIALDFLLAVTVSVVAAPVILLAALAVKLTSRGPAFYTQTRVGRNGRLFTIYKIRTMIHNAESLTGPRWAIPGDPRITRLGQLLRASHLDELPQLFNVLRGDMSLTGPRPERPEFVRELEKALPSYRQRLAVRPGVTGLAQVRLPADTDLESVRRKLQYDLYYIRELSPWLDLRLVLCTACHMLGV